MTAPVETPTEPEITQEAARAMLAALREAIGWHERFQRYEPWMAQARAAIALAEGRAS